MALDQIWKPELALVTYGNEYLSQDYSFAFWVKHSIFNQHVFNFRDLMSQHLLAQHFQIWLEGLKKQGVYRLSLHNASLLNEEQNPNANVELLAIPHFIVSHEKNKKTAWIFGKELAEWHSGEKDYEAPSEQRSDIRSEIFWRFELNPKLSKRIENDLAQPNWDDIHNYTDNELFDSKFAQGFIEPSNRALAYYGVQQQQNSDGTIIEKGQYLPILPKEYSADYANDTLVRFDALSTFIQDKIQHPYNENGEILSPDDQLNLRHFSQKIDDLHAKFIVKVANHYKTAKITKVEAPSPFDEPSTNNKVLSSIKRPEIAKHQQHQHPKGKTGVLALIIITVIICAAAYYFGL